MLAETKQNPGRYVREPYGAPRPRIYLLAAKHIIFFLYSKRLFYGAPPCYPKPHSLISIPT